MLIVLLGVWGAIVAFIGPYFRFAYPPDTAWTWTALRGWLEVLPGCVAIVSGLIIMGSAHRVSGMVAAWLAVVAGAWFVVGPQLSGFAGIGAVGSPTQNSAGMVTLQSLAYFYALGAIIVFLAATALGRFSVRDLTAPGR